MILTLRKVRLVRLVTFLSLCFHLRLVARLVVRLVRLVFTQVIEIIALGEKKMRHCARYVLTYIPGPRLLGRRGRVKDMEYARHHQGEAV